jgi:hypothetical protein
MFVARKKYTLYKINLEKACQPDAQIGPFRLERMQLVQMCKTQTISVLHL